MSEEETPYYTRKDLWPINCDDDEGLDKSERIYSMKNESGDTAMVKLKKTLKQDARRHSSKLVGKILGILPDLPELAKDAIHQEILYATMDGYRKTMKYQSEKENQNGQDETKFNC